MPYTAPDRQALLDAIGPIAPMLGDKLRPTSGGGWRLGFHPQDTITSEQGTHARRPDGDHFVHTTDPHGFATAVKDFLDTLS